ncbi:MAG: Asp-tRNA(Asn)/Glu-tRNA(Gln) amidotransferase subunit GatA [Candidatus Pacebacteria bacterium]|nr:Asp-tRNA(Asn)/Glu-tRNA(Gln) amidotransferase subunit GatA [Candidatus Paceibacterota bacterium]
MEIIDLDIQKAAKGLADKEFSSVELTQSCLEKIKKTDNELKSFITVTDGLALKEAARADERIKSGENNPLLGIPSSIKDVILTKNILTTASSNILKNYIPAESATLMDKLDAKGMVMLGKVNCDAFAHGSSTENSDFFTSHNPWDLDRVPGGSSGGSASSVAGGECFYSIGTDTGGSIRQPASFCGLVGLKPTYGRVSRYGLISMTSSTDCPSIMAKTAGDAAIILEAIAGEDKKDATTSSKPVDKYLEYLQNFNIKGLRIGIPKEYFIEGLNKDIEESVRGAIVKLQGLGAEVVEISLPHTKYAVPTYYIITPSEVSSNLAKFDGIRFGYSSESDSETEVKNLMDVYIKSKGKGFGSEAKRRIMIGTYALSSGYYDAYYLKAQKVRALIKKDFDEVFEKVDIIIAPTAPSVAFKIGEHSDNPLEMYLGDIFLSAVSLAGLPAVSAPCGFVKPEDGEKEMPVGMQIIGKPFDEKTVLAVADIYEKDSGWTKKHPQI